MTAIGKALEPAFRSKLERDYAARLEAQQCIGQIRAWWYEDVALRIGHDCRIHVDFMVQMPDLSIEFHETKGPHQREDSIVKLRAAAAKFPFVFRLVTRSKAGAWQTCEVGAPQQRQKEALPPFSAYEAHAAHVRYAIREFDRASKRAESVPGCCADDEPPACSKGGKSGAVVTASRRTEAGASAAPICEGVGCTRRTSTPPFCFQHKDFGRPSSATKERMATLAGKPVTREYALDLIRRG